MQIKRVATLYRVSTKAQLDGNDIPMQQRACRRMIEKQEGWRLVKNILKEESQVSKYLLPTEM